MLLVDVRHLHCSRREFVVDENEYRRIRSELDALADDVNELTDRQVRRHQVIVLVDVCNRSLVALFGDDRNSIRILETNSSRFSLALLCESPKPFKSRNRQTSQYLLMQMHARSE